MAKVRADVIKHALSKRHSKDFFMTEVKNGPTHIAGKGELLIMDAVAIKKSWVNPCIDGYEVKVDRQDFLRDEKWMGYKEYCNRLSFVCPSGLIDPEELPDDIGLIYYNPEKGTLYTKRKALYREIEVSGNMLYYILMNKLDSDRHPFFSSQREMLEAYLEDKETRSNLARRFESKLIKELDEMGKKLRELEREANSYKADAQNFKKVMDILKRHGLSRLNWETELEEHLSSKMPPNVIDIAERLRRDAEQLVKMTRAE